MRKKASKREEKENKKMRERGKSSDFRVDISSLPIIFSYLNCI